MREIIKFRLKPGECRTIAGRRICNRWQKRTAEASGEYTQGVKNPKRSWGKCTCEAQDRYKAGVDAAHSRGAFKKGARKTGSRGWKAKTLLKGPTRFAEGVHGAGSAFAEGYEPYHKHFKGIQLPKKFPRGDPRNIQRCAAVTSAYGMVKVGRVRAGEVICPET